MQLTVFFVSCLFQVTLKRYLRDTLEIEDLNLLHVVCLKSVFSSTDTADEHCDQSSDKIISGTNITSTSLVFHTNYFNTLTFFFAISLSNWVLLRIYNVPVKNIKISVSRPTENQKYKIAQHTAYLLCWGLAWALYALNLASKAKICWQTFIFSVLVNNQVLQGQFSGTGMIIIINSSSLYY
jgi:hypothetical protein